MFSAKLTRVAVPRTPSTASISTSATVAAQRPSPCLASTRRTHQRRHSSSKASCPPDNNKPAAAAKAAAAQGAPASAAESSPKTPGKRASRHKRSQSQLDKPGKSKVNVDQFAGLPSVRDVQHLHGAEFGLSSFFSMHRPLSLKTPVPPPSTNEAFNSIFESNGQNDPWSNGNSAERRPEDVTYTLHNAIEAIEGASSGLQEEGMRWETVQENGNGKSLEDLVAMWKPFQAPPPPQAFADESKPSTRKRSSKQARGQQPLAKQKSYMATIKLTESTLPNGKTSWTASSSQMVPIPDAEESASIKVPQTAHRQPFLERMRRRGQLYTQAQQNKRMVNPAEQPERFIRQSPSAKRVKMQLISVKRQRKLKMKKHKYKKLMKRTRNLRRRLDRT